MCVCEKTRFSFMLIQYHVYITKILFVEKHHIEVSEMKNNYNELKNQCDILMESREKSAVAFKEKQNELREMVLHSQENFKKEIQQFIKNWIEYKETSAPNSDLYVIGS